MFRQREPCLAPAAGIEELSQLLHRTAELCTDSAVRASTPDAELLETLQAVQSSADTAMLVAAYCYFSGCAGTARSMLRRCRIVSDVFFFLRVWPAFNFRSAVSSLGRLCANAQVAHLDEKEVEKEV